MRVWHEGLAWLGQGEVPEHHAMVVISPFPHATLRHTIAGPAMPMHLARAGAGMTLEVVAGFRTTSHYD